MNEEKIGTTSIRGMALVPLMAGIGLASVLALWGGSVVGRAAIPQGGVRGVAAKQQSTAGVEPAPLPSWTHLRHNYGTRAELTDLRRLQLGIDFMVTVDSVSATAHAGLHDFVESVPFTGVWLESGGRRLGIRFHPVGSKMVAFIPQGAVASGRRVSLVGVGTTTVPYLGHPAGPGTRILEATFAMP